MNITERAAKVLQEIDAAIALAEKATPGPWRSKFDDRGFPGVETVESVRTACMDLSCSRFGEREDNAVFIAASRTLLPASLRCLKTAIEGMLAECKGFRFPDEDRAHTYQALTNLCDQWENK